MTVTESDVFCLLLISVLQKLVVGWVVWSRMAACADEGCQNGQ